MAFTHPQFLLLLLLIPWSVMAARRGFADLSRWRWYAAVVVRTVVILSLVLALAGAQWVRRTHDEAAWFLVDASASVSPQSRAAALDYVRGATRRMRADDRAGLILFAGNGEIEHALDAAMTVGRVHTHPDVNATDMARAIRLAVAALPPGCVPRIVLLSDGNENRGSALEEATLAAAGGIRIDTVPLRREQRPEALLEKMVVRSRVKEGEPFDVKLVASSDRSTPATVKLFRNRRYLGEQEIHLPPGKSVIAFKQTLTKPGFYTFDAILDAEKDTFPENNRATGFVQVKGRPRILLVDSEPQELRGLAAALRGAHIDVTVTGPDGIPVSMAEMQNIDALVLSDVPSVAMSNEQMQMIRSAVRDLGMGFAMLGGEDSFGVGGYYETPVEDALPVRMDLTSQQYFPSAAMVIVVDKSGSMAAMQKGVEKIMMANEAACKVIDLLKPQDKIAVLGVDSAAKVVVPMQAARDRDTIKARIRTMRAGGGGIFCYTGLERANAILQQTSARVKHVIMMADANDSEQQEGSLELAARMRRAGITVTAIGLGVPTDVHVHYLQSLAKAGGGSFYLTSDSHQLPQLYTRDAMIMARSLIIEEPFLPIVQDDSEILRGIDWGAAPPLLGHVATSAKATASVPLITRRRLPLLATWHYGLGRSLAFTSDAKRRWAAHWMEWPGYAKFWSQALRWIVRSNRDASFQTLLDVDGDRGHVTVDAIDEQGRFVNFLRARATVATPSLTRQTLQLEQTAPGRYEADFSANQPGAYMVNVVRTTESGQTESDVTGVAIPYPPEYRTVAPDTHLLSRIAEVTGGRYRLSPDDVFGGARPAARSARDIWHPLLLLAILLFPLDVAIRRVMVEPGQVLALAVRFVQALRPRHPAPQPSRVGTLLERKSAVWSKLHRQASAPAAEPRPSAAATARAKAADHSAEHPTESAVEQSDTAEQPATMARLLRTKRRIRGDDGDGGDEDK